MLPRRIINLDISTIPYNAQGIPGFLWPYHPEDIVPVIQNFTFGLAEILEKRRHSNAGLSLSVLFKWINVELLRVYEALLILTRYQRLGVEVQPPSHFRLLSAFLQGRQPACTLFRNLAQGPARDSKLVFFTKKIIRELQWNEPWRVLIGWKEKKKQYSAILPTSLALKHARDKGRYLHYDSLGRWFPAINPLILEKSLTDSESLAVLNGITALFEQTVQKTGEIPTIYPYVLAYLKDWMTQATRFTITHLNQLSRREISFPFGLWTGCAGASIWSAVLSHALRQSGRTVVGHDHGSGNSHINQLPHNVTNFNSCDVFYTYNLTSARIKQREMRTELLFLHKPAVVTCPEIEKGTSLPPPSPRTTVARGKIRKIVYVPTAFHGEGGKLQCYLSDLTYLDWQARLLGFLRSSGVKIIHKPHPEGASKPPQRFAESFGFRTFPGRFEDIQEPIDAYLIDFIASSTTAKILCSSLPVIFINPGYPQLLPEAATLLARRCSLINGWIDRENRVQIHWHELSKTLEADSHSFDTAFTDLYCANTANL